MNDSVSEWVGRLKSGDADAAQKLWERYSAQLIGAARSKLGKMPRSAADEEDVALSVFTSICRGAAEGRFANVKSRDELWWLLLAITRQKIVDYVRRETANKRGAGRVQLESALAGEPAGSGDFRLDRLVGQSPTPEFLTMLAEQYNNLLQILHEDRMQKIAIWRIEGYTDSEIATKLGVSVRTVERKLVIIRDKWASVLSDAV